MEGYSKLFYYYNTATLFHDTLHASNSSRSNAGIRGTVGAAFLWKTFQEEARGSAEYAIET